MFLKCNPRLDSVLYNTKNLNTMMVQLFMKDNTYFTENLQELKEKEKEAEYFTKMPSKHYMEIASLLLSR